MPDFFFFSSRIKPQIQTVERERKTELGGLTNLQLALYSLHVPVSVLGLDGVAVAHQLHKLLGQNAVLRKETRTISSLGNEQQRRSSEECPKT